MAAACVAQTRSLDLTRYGLQGASNPHYKPRLFTTAMDYLNDGTLIVAFPAPFTSLDPEHGHTFGVQRDIIVHLDPRTGKLLHKFEAGVSNEIHALSATPDGGFLLVEGREIAFFNSDCHQVSSLSVPLDVISIELHPSRKYLTLAIGGADSLQLNLISTTTHSSMQQLQSSQTPIAMLDDGFAYLEKYHAPGVVMPIGHGGHHVVNYGYDVHFLTAHPSDYDLGFVLDCPVVFQPAHAEAAAFSTCGTTSFVDAHTAIQFKDTVPHATPLLFASASAAPRVAYLYALGSFNKTPQQLRENSSESGVRVIDLAHRNVVAALQLNPQPRVGGAIALSPDGRELAVLTDKAVLLTELH